MAEMVIETTVVPADEPVSRDEAKLHLRQDLDADDALIDSAISAAREWAEGFSRLRFITQTVTLRSDVLGQGFRLPIGPVQSVGEVRYIDTTGAQVVLAADQYKLIKSRKPNLIVPAYGVSWPVTRAELDAVEVDVIVGFGDAPSDVPADIVQAVKMMLGHFYNNRSNEVVGMTTSKHFIRSQQLLEPYILW